MIVADGRETSSMPSFIDQEVSMYNKNISTENSHRTQAIRIVERLGDNVTTKPSIYHSNMK